jgi:hypothetical protein
MMALFVKKASEVFASKEKMFYTWEGVMYEIGSSVERKFDFLKGEKLIMGYYQFKDSELIIDFYSRCFRLKDGQMVSQIEGVNMKPYDENYILVKIEKIIESDKRPKYLWNFYDIISERKLANPIIEDLLIVVPDLMLSLNRRLTAYRPHSINPIWKFDLYNFFDSLGDNLMKQALDNPLKLHFIRVLGKWENYLVIEFNKYRLMYLDFETGALAFLSDNLALKHPDVLAISNPPNSDRLLLDWHLDQERGKVYSLNANVFVEFDLLAREWTLKKEFPLLIPGSWFFTRSVFWGNKLFFTAQKRGYLSDVLGAFDIDKLEVVWFHQFDDSIGPIRVNDHYVVVCGLESEWYLFTHEEIESEIQKTQNQ